MPTDVVRWADGGLGFAAALAAAISVFVALYLGWRRRNTPEERERRRRYKIGREGRLVNGLLHDIEEDEERRLLHYTYRIGAVDYSACQDVTALAEEVGVDPKGIVGGVMVKVHQKNPYNSIVVSEGWSGLRRVAGAAAEEAPARRGF